MTLLLKMTDPAYKVFPLLLFLIGFGNPTWASPYLSNSQSEADRKTSFSAKRLELNIQGFPFEAFTTRDTFERNIRFYLSKTKPGNESKRLPLVVVIQGSGCQSIFVEVNTPDGVRVASTGPEAVILKSFRDKCRVLVVEKPGVPFKFQPRRPGSSEEGSPEYLKEFSLGRWVQAIHAATLAASRLPQVDSSQTLVLGHSEGGQVACELAKLHPKITHVAVMAGGGPTQLFDFLKFARLGQMYDPNASPDERVAALMNDWKKVLADPTATDKFILGHTHLRWSSFTRSSPVEAILQSKAKVFIAQGTNDTNSLPDSAEVLYAELLARGREVVYERVEGGNHGFMRDGDNGKGWFETNEKAVRWFLKDIEPAATNQERPPER